MSASCTKSTLGTTAPCSTAQHIYSTNIDIRVSIKVMADGGQQQMIQITSSTFSQLPSLLSHLSIHHNHHLSIINLSILDLSSVKYLHLVTKSSTSSTSPLPHSLHNLCIYLLSLLHATFPLQFPILPSHLSILLSYSYASCSVSKHIEQYIHFPSTSQSFSTFTSPLLFSPL